MHFPAEKLNSRLSVNRLSLVRRQPHCWQVMDGTAVSPVINTVPWLNKADSFVSITFEPLKPSVNCICLPAEVYSRLFAKSGSSVEIIQLYYRHQADTRAPTPAPGPPPGLTRVSTAAACMLPISLNTQQVSPGKNKKQGERRDTEARIRTLALPPALCATPAK